VKFIIDMATPKQVNFFKPFYEELLRRGHEAVIVTRDLYETTEALKRYGLKATSCERQALGDKMDKLSASLYRMMRLRWVFETVKPDALITLANASSTHVAYRLGVPVYNFCDIPESVHACKLTFLLSKKMFIPFVVTRYVIHQYGVPDENIVSYNALDVCAYMHTRKRPTHYMKQCFHLEHRIGV